MLNKNDMIIVTGGAGFIGSCVVRTLNDRGFDNLMIVDNIALTDKWKNIRNKRYLSYINRDEFLPRLQNGEYDTCRAIIHMGACSSTTERDFDYLWKNNVEYTKTLWNFCTDRDIPFIYASSAATYGDGKRGFSDSLEGIYDLLPLNGYGYSKQAFDLWSLKQDKKPPQHVGLKFFNVYGPNEYCKGSMASMIFHGFNQVQETEKIRLFKSYDSHYADGGQERDFVYVKDVCEVILFFLEHPDQSGIFNVGTGRAQTFKELAEAVFEALGKLANIEYFDMPEALRPNYQYHTQADLTNLRRAGYTKEFMDLRAGAADYVIQHLAKNYEVY